jgi:hypothetical protein
MTPNFGRDIAMAMTKMTAVGIDLGKNAFHLTGLDERRAIVIRQRLSRGQLERRFAWGVLARGRGYDPAARAVPRATTNSSLQGSRDGTRSMGERSTVAPEACLQPIAHLRSAS